jgi:hypothetical protein
MSLRSAHQVGQRRGDEAGERLDRRDDRAEHLAAQHVGRRQGRERLDLLGRDGLPREDAAADDEHAGLAYDLAQRLRGADGVAVTLEERDRGRPLEQRQQRLVARRLGGAPRERVLDDGEPGAVLEQLVAEPLHLGVRQPAVVRDDQGVRGADALRQPLDHLLLLSLQHRFTSFSMVRARREAGPSAKEESVLEFRLGRTSAQVTLCY